MIIRFKASGIVAMILYIPLLLALGLVLAFLVPLLAIMVALAGIAFTAFFVFARIGLARKKLNSSRDAKKPIEIRHYKVK
ncbi:hypothetical protein HYU18_02465 [Candidatus Woesearchaeota archaeon]|nr:hypothetical protein [Candidatus Woesearchaeota archaeon]